MRLYLITLACSAAISLLAGTGSLSAVHLLSVQPCLRPWPQLVHRSHREAYGIGVGAAKPVALMGHGVERGNVTHWLWRKLPSV
ncbi:hypothetical protein OEZ86_004360 [Tetradesmus obliquus]|nr:hypothetical protein OEZ86_004360 [Tetradesmus obliquus]